MPKTADKDSLKAWEDKPPEPNNRLDVQPVFGASHQELVEKRR